MGQPAGVVELVDTEDLKSSGLNLAVRVQVPSPAYFSVVFGRHPRPRAGGGRRAPGSALSGFGLGLRPRLPRPRHRSACLAQRSAPLPLYIERDVIPAQV